MILRRKRNMGPLEVLHDGVWKDWRDQSLPATYRAWLNRDHHRDDRLALTLYSGKKFLDLEVRT